MKKIKHIGNFIKDLVLIFYKIIRNRRIWMGVGIITFLYVYAYFWRNYYIQSPIKDIKYQCFICKAGKLDKVATVSAQVVQEKTTIVALKPIKTEKEIVMENEYGEDLWKIYFLESSLGKNDGCRKEGKFGGFGVMSQGGVVCYDSFQKAVDRAGYWWKQALEGNTKDEALCVWNLGKKMPMCSYSQTFMSL